MGDERQHAKMQGKTGCCIGAAAQVVTRMWSALSKFIRLSSFQNAYLPYFLCKRRMAMLQVLKSREDDFFNSFTAGVTGGLKGLENGEEEVKKGCVETHKNCRPCDAYADVGVLQKLSRSS